MTGRTPLDGVPGKSGAVLERVMIDGQGYVLKHLDLSDDWTMRASGSLRGAPLELWERGILARLPGCFNQPIVGAAPEERVPGAGPAGSGRAARLCAADAGRDAVAGPGHRRGDPARPAPELPAAYGRPARRVLGVRPRVRRDPGGAPLPRAVPWTAQAEAATEAATGTEHLVPQLVGRGWPLLAQVAPDAAAVVTPLARDPGPLVNALARTPHTFVHGNWKLDNLGTDDTGRTVVLDWEQPGVGAPLSDLAWYLAINCRRLPQPKEASIAVYRDGLEDCGIDTAPWWDRQLALCLLGGWSSSAGRRPWAATTRSWRGGRPRRCRPHPCSAEPCVSPAALSPLRH